MKIKTYVGLILDKSGSMNSLKEFAINTFNEQIQTLKAESNSPKESTLRLLKGKGDVEGVETKLTLVSFNDNVQFHKFNEDVNAIQEFPADEYKPDGSTALFDAIGETIDRFTTEIPDLVEENSGALIIVITDGQENASKTYGGENGRKRLRSRIEELEKTDKWTITFMGCEKVMETAVDHLGLNVGNTRSWDPTQQGLAYASAVNTISTQNYMTARAEGTTSVKDFYKVTDEKEIEEAFKKMMMKKEWTQK
jgi:hypothetical protein